MLRGTDNVWTTSEMAPCLAVPAALGMMLPSSLLDEKVSVSSKDVLVDLLGIRPEDSIGINSLPPKFCIHFGTLHCLLPRKLALYRAPASIPHPAEIIEFGGCAKTS